jgi:hypothetical protein
MGSLRIRRSCRGMNMRIQMGSWSKSLLRRQEKRGLMVLKVTRMRLKR